jgi:hypothetical protein
LTGSHASVVATASSQGTIPAMIGPDGGWRLLVYTLEDAPTDWAMTQNNLGATLGRLGELMDDAEMLLLPEQAYRNALLVYTHTMIVIFSNRVAKQKLNFKKR